ncbi:MAG TPA: hypothetical protein VK469_12335 [Candidatus Kapabacteria bacterium]|nr:hypothetical protein [Candidatus Kapabacteria bacterium]
MLKKEFNEILKESLLFIVLMAGLPVLLLILDMFFKWSLTYNQVFFPTYQVGLFTFAVLLGVTLFSSEKKQGSIEYVLTLPFSRMRLLWMKILPRLVALGALLLLYSLYMIIVTGGKNIDSLLILPLFYFIFPVFFIFIISVSLSASHDNIVSLAILVIFIFIIHSLLIPSLPRIIPYLFGKMFSLNKPIYAVLSTLGFLVPFAVPFVLTFRKFDLHPAQRFNRRYFKVFIPLLLAGIVLSAIFVYSVGKPMFRYNFWYLTGNHKVIETDWDFTRIYDKDSGKIATLDTSFYHTIIYPLESGGYLYTYDNSKHGRQYNRLNVTNNTVENIYTLKGSHLASIWGGVSGGWLFKDEFAFFEGRSDQQNIMLVLVNLNTRAVTKIKLPAKLQERYRVLRVFGVDETGGKRAWLVYGEKGLRFPVFRIWEDGNSQELAIRGRSLYFINNMLLSQTDEGMFFYRLTETGSEEIKSDSRGKLVQLLPFNRKDLNSVPSKVVYGQYFGRLGKTLMKVDLEKLEVTKLLDFDGTILYYSPEECYLLDSHLNPRHVYRVLPDGQLQLLRTFSGFNTRAGDNFMQRSRNGIITRENGKISIYAFPDLQEILFKELN